MGANAKLTLLVSVLNKMIEAAPGGSLSSVSSTYTGVTPSTGSYTQYNQVKSTRDRYAQCLQDGLTGDALRRCAAPTRTGVFTNVFQ